MKLRRLLHADIADIADRLAQEAQRRLDRYAVALRPEGPPSLRLFGHLRADIALTGAGIPPGAPARARTSPLQEFRAWNAAHFFAGAAGDAAPEYFATRLRPARERVLAAADALCAGRFDLLGYRELVPGTPIDWHRDPVSGRCAARVHWSRLDPLDAGEHGDCKLIWELNRHQWFLDLGQAYLFSGDERYARTFAESLQAWMRDNPPGMGINWASSLEVAYRLIAWCWALALFRRSTALSPPLFSAICAWLRAHAAHVERYLSRYFSPNTHLTGEALGLFYAGIMFPGFPEARRWRRLGARILLQQLRRQVLPDGVYFEQSTCYQRYTADIYLQFLILAARNGVELPASVAQRVQRLLDHLLALRRPDGSMPQVGDADGGRLLPLARRDADDFRDLFAVAAAWYRRADYAWAAEGEAPELFWLLGSEGCAAFDSLRPEPPAVSASRLFRDGGQGVMRSGWGRHAHQLLFDVGPLGCRVSGAHGHADLLGVQCAAFGEPMLVDPGTYCYTADAAWRDHFRSSAAHSTVTVDGRSQAEPAGPFSWRERPRARLRRWFSTESFDLADAYHDAYRSLPDPVRHRRRVYFAKPHWWLLVDDLYGAAAHGVELRFQFAPLALALNAADWASAEAAGGQRLHLRAFAPVPLQTQIFEGELDPPRGWVSADYGRKQAAPLLVYSATAPLPLRIATLIVPAETAEVPRVESSFSGDDWRLAFADGQEIHVDDREIRVACAASPAS